MHPELCKVYSCSVNSLGLTFFINYIHSYHNEEGGDRRARVRGCDGPLCLDRPGGAGGLVDMIDLKRIKVLLDPVPFSFIVRTN